VLGGRCDGRKPRTEPAVVEGAPPVPMAIRNFTITIEGAPAETAPPRLGVYPQPGAPRAHLDTVPKVFFSRPVTGVTAQTFTVTDSTGAVLPAWVDPIGDGVWGLFANQILYKPGSTYTAHLAAGICDAAAPTNCTKDAAEWSFTIAADADSSQGDSGVPIGFSGATAANAPRAGSAVPGAPAAPATKAAAPAAPAAPATKAAAPAAPATKAPAAAAPAIKAAAPAAAPATKAAAPAAKAQAPAAKALTH
jgi:hypothetical protein